MLNDISVTVATNIVDSLSDSNIRVAARPSTLIGELTNATTPDILSGYTPSEPPSSGPSKSEHDILTDNYTLELASLVSNHISHVKSVVKPIVVEYEESVRKAISDYKFKDPEEFFKINYFKPHEIFLSDVIDKPTGKAYNDYVPMYFTQLDDADFCPLTYICTGDTSTDEMIKNWFNDRYTAESILNYVKTDYVERIYSLALTDRLDLLLYLALFYRALSIKTDLVCPSMGAVDLKLNASYNRDYFFNLLADEFKTYILNVKNGKVVLYGDQIPGFNYNSGPYNVTIIEENFEKLAEGGGSIETVFGYLTTKSSSYLAYGVPNIADGPNANSYAEMIKNKDHYNKQWANSRNLYLIYMNNSKIDIIKNTLSTCFSNYTNETFTANHEPLKNLSYMKDVQDRVNEYITHLYIDDVDTDEKLSDVCLMISAGILFNYSCAYAILSDIYKALRDNPDLPVDEAALEATMNYQLEFFIAQADIR